MAATGILSEAVNAVSTVISGLGLKPVTDPRNARPLSVMIELPTISAFTYNVGDITVLVRVLGAPPANSDVGDYLMSTADTLINSALSVTGGRPGMASYGGQDLPTYDLTVAVSVKRN
jgi:hypothetical protein